MKHLLIRQRSQRLFLFLIFSVVLFFVLKFRFSERGQNIKFETFLERKPIVQESYFANQTPIDYLPFTGYIKPLDKKANFSIGFLNGKVFVNLAHPLKDRLIVKSRLENVNFKKRRVFADILVAVNLRQNSGISGWASVRNLKIDKDSLPVITSKFEYHKDRLNIVSLRFGKSYILNGSVGLAPPKSVDLDLKIYRANIKDLAIIARVKDPDIIYGVLEGEFFIKGPIDNPVSKGNLIGRNGRIGAVTYETANINFEGFGPILRIVDSRIRQGEAVASLEGLIDLRNIGRRNLYDGIRAKTDEKAYVWEGWGITKNGTRQLEFKKEVSDEFKVGFKAFAQEGPLPYYGNREDEVNLEYKLKNESLKMKLKEDEEFLGLERKLKF